MNFENNCFAKDQAIFRRIYQSWLVGIQHVCSFYMKANNLTYVVSSLNYKLSFIVQEKVHEGGGRLYGTPGKKKKTNKLTQKFCLETNILLAVLWN